MSGPERAEGVAADFVEGADLVGAVHSAGAGAFGSKVRVVQDVEVLGAKLDPPAFRDQNILGELYVPVDGMRQTENIFADVSKGSKNGWIIAAGSGRCAPAGDFGWLKGSWIEPADAVYGSAAGGRAIRTYAGDKRAAIISDASAGKLGPLKDGDGTAAGGGDNSTYFVVTKEVMDQRTVTSETGGLPNIRAGKHMSVIETRRAIVELVAVRIVQREGGVAGIKTGDAFAKRKVVQAF